MPGSFCYGAGTIRGFGARTSRPLLFARRHASIVNEISMGGNVADETSALRYKAVPPFSVSEES